MQCQEKSLRGKNANVVSVLMSSESYRAVSERGHDGTDLRLIWWLELSLIQEPSWGHVWVGWHGNVLGRWLSTGQFSWAPRHVPFQTKRGSALSSAGRGFPGLSEEMNSRNRVNDSSGETRVALPRTHQVIPKGWLFEEVLLFDIIFIECLLCMKY